MLIKFVVIVLNFSNYC